MDTSEYNNLKFYKNNGKTTLDDPVDDSGFSLKDYIHPEESFNHSSLDMVKSSADKDDPLHNAIAEVYSPPTKHQHIEFTDPSAVASGDVDPVLSSPMPLPPKPLSTNPYMPTVPNPFTDNLSPPMTPAPPVNVSASTLDLDCDDNPKEPIPTSTPADVAEQQEECSAEIFEDMTHHLEQLAEDNLPDDLFGKVKSYTWDNGILILDIEWKMGETSSSPFTIMKRDYPYAVAHYILNNSVGTSDGRYASGQSMR